jgi:hypothetical protein
LWTVSHETAINYINMAEESNNLNINRTGGTKSIKTLPTYGNKKNEWRPLWNKFNAIGDAEGWSIAFKEERDLACDSEDKDDVKYVKANDIGLNFLLLSSYLDAFYYMEAADTLYQAVQNLQARYGSTDTVDLIDLLQEYLNCTPDKDTKCLDIWFMALEHLHTMIVTQAVLTSQIRRA